jgi:hypothetical protein
MWETNRNFHTFRYCAMLVDLRDPSLQEQAGDSCPLHLRQMEDLNMIN